MIKWSFSSLKQFKNCPRQYHEVRILKNFEIKDTAYTTYGKAVHKALEDYAKEKKPLPKNYERFKGIVDTLLNVSPEFYAEKEFALRIDTMPIRCP
jgi:ATP-dependent helicase/DNAse subunit B